MTTTKNLNKTFDKEKEDALNISQNSEFDNKVIFQTMTKFTRESNKGSFQNEPDKNL